MVPQRQFLEVRAQFRIQLNANAYPRPKRIGTPTPAASSSKKGKVVIKTGISAKTNSFSEDMHHTIVGGNGAPGSNPGLESAAGSSDKKDGLRSLSFDLVGDFPRPQAEYNCPTTTSSLLQPTVIPSVEPVHAATPSHKRLVEYDSEDEECVSLLLLLI